MSNNIAEAIAAKNEVISAQGTSLDTVLSALEGKAAGSGSDISLGIASATVGQTIKVKAVNEQGMPTAWEAADMSGSGEVWEKVCDETTTEDIGEWRYTSEALKVYKKFKFDFTYELNTGDSDRLFLNGRNASLFRVFGVGYSGDKFRRITGIIYIDEVKNIVVAEGAVQKNKTAFGKNFEGTRMRYEQSDTISQFPISCIGFRANTATIVTGAKFRVWGSKQ